MNLCFLGRGAMLYPNEGNNCCYFEDEKNFYLIDCGEDSASKLINLNKLNSNKKYYFFCTHTHSDHVGSLGTLIAYLRWTCSNKLNIVYDDNMEHLDILKQYLSIINLKEEDYNLIHAKELEKNKLFNSIEYVKTYHDKDIKSSGLIIDTNQGKILYTGDIKDEKVIIDFITENESNIDKIYIDTSLNENPVHIDIEKLKKIIPTHLNDKIYCMHINDNKVIKKAKEYGFHFVSNINFINKEDILEILNNYNINKEESYILSSASLVLQDIKETTRDIDIAVSKRLYEELLNNYNCLYEKTNSNGSEVYMIDDVINFSTNYYNSIEITNINGYKCQTIESIKKLKKDLNRKKDQYDLFLINQKENN